MGARQPKYWDLIMRCSRLAEYYYDVIHRSGELLVDGLVDDEVYHMVAGDMGYISYIDMLHLKRIICEMVGFYA
jgi:hypothetical protein